MEPSTDEQVNSTHEEEKEESINTQTARSKHSDKNGRPGGDSASKKKSAKKADKEDDDRYFDLEKLKSIPSYASVLNNPKKSNFLSSLYSATGEKLQPPDLSHEPSLIDIESYILKMQKSYTKYTKYHKASETQSAANKPLKKADAISAVNKVPEDYFKEDFRISPDFFKLKNKKELQARNLLLSDYLEIVENFLISHVAENFDFFSQSFDNIREMETEMGEIKQMIQEVRAINEDKKKQIVHNMLGVYFLNRRMTIMKQIREHLKLIKILRESIPVIRNLIKSGTSFNTVTELMEKSFRLINERLLPLNVALQLREKIHEAEGKSKKRVEEEFKQLLEINFNNIQFNP